MISHQVKGTHLLGGYLHYELIGQSQYKITVTLMLDPASGVRGGSGTIDFGDGQKQTNNFEFTLLEGTTGFNIIKVSTTHQYNSFGTFEISYTEQNYSPLINNLPSIQPFFIAATIVNETFVGQNQSPVLQLFNTQRGISGVAQRINTAAYDEDGDSLAYNIIVPRISKNRLMPAYTYPNASAFYINYNSGNQLGNGTPTYSISAASGEILWDAPELLGTYAMAYAITQWRKINGVWMNVGRNEVILINLIVDATKTITITSPTSGCYASANEVIGQFSLSNVGNNPAIVQLFSDAPDMLLNGLPLNNQVLSFTMNETLNLNFSVVMDENTIPFKLYHVIINVLTENQTATSSWTFSIGCDNLPGNVGPDPLIPVVFCDAINVYPNPANGQSIKVCLPEEKVISRIKIYTNEGKIIREVDAVLDNGIIELDIRDLTSGAYLLHIGDSTQKLIVIR
jgi:hypothetical protein